MATNLAAAIYSSQKLSLDTQLLCRRRVVAALFLSSIEVLREVSKKDSRRLGVLVLLLQLGSMCVTQMRVTTKFDDEDGIGSSRSSPKRELNMLDIVHTQSHEALEREDAVMAEGSILRPELGAESLPQALDDLDNELLVPPTSAALSTVLPLSVTKFFPWSVHHQLSYSSLSHSLLSALSPSLTPTSTLHLNGLHCLIIQDLSLSGPIFNIDIEDDDINDIEVTAGVDDDIEEPMEFAEPSPSVLNLNRDDAVYISDSIDRSDHSLTSTSSPSPYKKPLWKSQGPDLVSHIHFPVDVRVDERQHLDIADLHAPTLSTSTPARRPRPSLRKVVSATRRSFARLSLRDGSEDRESALEASGHGSRRHSFTSHVIQGSHSTNDGDDERNDDRELEMEEGEASSSKRSRKWSLRRLGSNKSLSSGSGHGIGIGSGLKALGHRIRKASEISHSSSMSDGNLAHDEAEGVKAANIDRDRRSHKLLKKRRTSSHVDLDGHHFVNIVPYSKV